MSRVGALAHNLHEGSRSEYLAQYLFASFGTAVAVPHQEDTGSDLHCSLTERRGQLAWPRAHYTLQVKSDAAPWRFSGEDSVRWLIEHPHALFLCIVEKRQARVRVYHTCPRFDLWARQRIPASLDLVPGNETSGGGMPNWDGGSRCNLGAPIIDVTVMDLLQDDVHRQTKEILTKWCELEQENLTSIRTGLLAFSIPGEYRTNSPELSGRFTFTGHTGDGSRAASQTGRAAGALVGSLLKSGDLLGASLCAMLERHLLAGEYSILHDVMLRASGAVGMPDSHGHAPLSAQSALEFKVADELIAHLRRRLNL